MCSLEKIACNKYRPVLLLLLLCLECPQPAMIHISATTERLLVAAELMELKKPYHDGSLREVSLANLNHFKNAGT